MSIKQNQAIKAATNGGELAQTLAAIMRKINVTVSHVTATGLASDLQTIATELAEFNAWDGTGTPPSTAKANPNYVPEFITRYVPKIDESGQVVYKTTTVTDSSSSSSTVEVEPRELVYVQEKTRNPEFDQQRPQQPVRFRNNNLVDTTNEYLFNSSTGLDVRRDGTLVGTEFTAAQLLTFLQVSAALDAFSKSTPEGFSANVGTTIESVVTI